MEFRSIELSDKEIFDRHFADNGYNIAGGSFAYWYAWGTDGLMEFAADDSALWIRMGYGGMLSPFPRDFSADMSHLPDTLRELGERRLLYVPGRVRDKLEADCPGAFEFKPKRDYFEYVYSGEDLRTLAGKHLHSKRNRINLCLRNHDLDYMEYRESDLPEITEMSRHWAEAKGITEEEFDQEHGAMVRMLRCLDMGVSACVIRENGRPVAYAVGSRLNERTACVHFEKCLPEYRDLYAYINREFARNAFPDCELINREEDMGDPGLRKAKLSYRPKYLEEFYEGILL